MERGLRCLRWYLNNFHREGDHLFLFHAVELPTIPVIGSGELFYKETLNEIIKEKHEEIKILTVYLLCMSKTLNIFSRTNTANIKLTASQHRPTDKASDFESEDCVFESHRGRLFNIKSCAVFERFF